MADVFIIEVDSQTVHQRLAELRQRVTDLTPAMRAIAGALVDGMEEAFQREADPATATPWQRLSEITIGQRERLGYWPGKKLQRRGHLVASLTPRYGADYAEAGTNVRYAITHQLGAQRGEYGIGHYKTRRGNFPIPWGDIPARPFAGFGTDTEAEVLDIIQRYLG